MLLVDVDRFATEDIEKYKQTVSLLKHEGLDADEIKNCDSLESILKQYGGVYLTSGLKSLKSIPDNSVDFVWSQAVLERVRLNEFDETLKELARVVGEKGVFIPSYRFERPSGWDLLTTFVFHLPCRRRTGWRDRDFTPTEFGIRTC